MIARVLVCVIVCVFVFLVWCVVDGLACVSVFVCVCSWLCACSNV